MKSQNGTAYSYVILTKNYRKMCTCNLVSLIPVPVYRYRYSSV